MNLSELRDIIRSEADIQGLREYQNLIDNLINQEMQRFTAKGKFPELIEEFSFSFVDDMTSKLEIPVDFQSLQSLTYYPQTVEQGIPLGGGTSFGFYQNFGGSPKFYTRIGNSFYVYPYSNTLIGDSLKLTYYKKPEMLLDTDELQVPILETAIVQAVMGRMLSKVDTNRAQLAKAEANRAFIDARAQTMGS